jgi:serine/threonine-protein kinase
MDAVRWERMQSLFHRAADLPEPDRRAFVESECGDDRTLAERVVAMLDEDARGGSLLDHGLAEVAHRVLGRDAARTLPLERFGAYRITSLLGEGGMGVVYLARREDLGSLAAIKVLRDAWLSPARRERFASEQRTLAQLDHPSIARLYDADALSDGTPWFVMEYVDGAPLTTYCARHASSIAARLRLFRDVCEAVQHAHRHAVIHRDLKPSNILVRPDGTPKLLDFGIAKQLESLDATADQTRTGLRLMTPAYAAPEQIRGGPVGVHTDVYALGVILYELLAGRLPFDVSSLAPLEAETAMLEQEPERPSLAVRRTPMPYGGGSRHAAGERVSWPDLDVLVLTAMHKDPQRRYRTVEALVRDIDHYLKGEPLEARPDSLGYRVEKFVRRNARAVAVTAVTSALVLALVVFYTVRLTHARNEALAAATRTERIQRFVLDLFQGGDPETGPSDSLRVITLIDRGVDQARSLDREPEVQAELALTLGGIYEQLGNFARADSLLQSSLARRRALLGPEHPDVARSLVALGVLRIEQARFDEAERLIRDGLAMSRRTLPPNDARVADAAAALGRVLQERGRYDDAIAELAEVVRLRGATPADTNGIAASLAALADAYYYAGRYDTSDSLNERVLALRRAQYGPRHPLVADVLMNLGASRFDRGNFAEAERYDREALAIIEPWYGAEHHETAHALTMLGRALVQLNRYDEAVAMLRRALAIQERVYGPTHPLVASAVNELGSAALALDHYDDAEAAFRRMIDIYRAAYGERHYLMGIAVANLASVYLAKREYARAEPLLRRAVAIDSAALSPDHVNTGIARIKLGRALVRQNQFREAEPQSRAGYEIVAKQTTPSVSWLRAARRDLVAEYDQLGRPADAARFRAELADSASR